MHIQDVVSDPHYDRAHASVGAWRRMLAVPMLREGVPLGAIVAAWAEAGATPKQHEDQLMTTFADQAVIAIENVRLLNELRARTDGACAIGRGATRARRGHSGGQLDTRPAKRAEHHRRKGDAAFRH